MTTPKSNGFQIGLVEVPAGKINHLKGNASTTITRPTTDSVSYLVLDVVVGHFIMTTSAETLTYAAVPAATLTDGTGVVSLRLDKPMVIMAPEQFTVIGSSASAVLTYWWA